MKKDYQMALVYNTKACFCYFAGNLRHGSVFPYLGATGRHINAGIAAFFLGIEELATASSFFITRLKKIYKFWFVSNGRESCKLF